MMYRFIIYLLIFISPFINEMRAEHDAESEEGYMKIAEIYDELDLEDYGLSFEAYSCAIVGYQKLEEEGRLDNPDLLTIVDFSQSSNNKRLYVLDLKEKKLLFNTWVSHGRNTGDEFAEYFSNTDGSLQSSLGFYLTKKSNMGATVGFSLILEGLEEGVNDNAKTRQIIMHGADYATEDFINQTGRLGRSYGCPAVPPEMIEPIVDVISNGSLLFIYYPDSDYLDNSVLLAEEE